MLPQYAGNVRMVSFAAFLERYRRIVADGLPSTLLDLSGDGFLEVLRLLWVGGARPLAQEAELLFLDRELILESLNLLVLPPDYLLLSPTLLTVADGLLGCRLQHCGEVPLKFLILDLY